MKNNSKLIHYMCLKDPRCSFPRTSNVNGHYPEKKAWKNTFTPHNLMVYNMVLRTNVQSLKKINRRFIFGSAAALCLVSLCNSCNCRLALPRFALI